MTSYKLLNIPTDCTVIGTAADTWNPDDIYRSLIVFGPNLETNAFLFTISDNAKLNVMNLDIHAPQSNGVFRMTSGAVGLELERICVISKEGDHLCSLIETESGTVMINECRFESEDSLSPATFLKPVINLQSAEESFSFSHTEFNRFQMTCGLLDLSTAGIISFHQNTINDVWRSDENDSLVIVSSHNLSMTVPRDSWSIYDSEFVPLNQFLGRDLSLPQDDPFYESTLLFYVFPPVNTVHFGGSYGDGGLESTHPNCGSYRLRCSTLDAAITSACFHWVMDVQIVGPADFNETVTVTSFIQIKSGSELETVTQIASGVIELGSLSDLFISNISFVLNPSSEASCLFSVQQGSLELSNCKIGNSESTTTLGSELTRLVDVGSYCKLVLRQTTIMNLAFSHSDNGTLFYLASNAQIVIHDTDSIPYEIMSNGSGFIIFAECDDIALTAGSYDYDIVKYNITVPKNHPFTEAERNRFVGEDQEQKQESFFWTWFPHTDTEEKIYADKEGMDHHNCGLIAMPCSSFEMAFKSQKTATTKLLLNTESNLTQGLTKMSTTLTTTPFILDHRETLFVNTSGSINLMSATLVFEYIDFEKHDERDDMMASLLFSLSDNSNLTLFYVSLTSITHSGYGAVISSDSFETISLDNVEFKYCNEESLEDGRVIHIAKDSFSSGDVIMKAVSFTVTEGREGTDVLLKGAGIENTVTKESFDKTLVNDVLFGQKFDKLDTLV
ncbi:hypothetical protein BLNAU_13816 [Blattamonas nauphoetae]|uniref:Uncharacterized protein n=1 Tax=Blattamonas nauphoetae TaxID=2049346 RepID=A0ABQ9XID1_9EUKA|nr:hypothetical protein BLNAU_13816 [Blattamonas nauphoetae]